MIASIHLLVGGAVGVATKNPAAAVAAGVVSHFILDAIPHADHPDGSRDKNGEVVWNKKMYIFAFTDSIIGGLIILSLWILYFGFPDFTSPFIWGAVGGYLPDFIDNVPFWKHKVRRVKIFARLHQFHEWIHTQWEAKWPMPKNALLGISTQIVAIFFSWYLLS
jgi:hypothetical protein